MPDPLLQSWLIEALARQTGRPIRTLRFSGIGGGSINDAYRVDADDGASFFCKINTTGGYPGLFKHEKNGLALLGRAGVIRTPEPVLCGETGNHQVLVLEWIEGGLKSPSFWHRFGRQLAALHRLSADAFGLAENNYMGALQQDNSPMATWVDFLVHRRLMPQVKLARDRQLLTAPQAAGFDRIYARLPDLFPEEPPALLHGDLWSGNFLADDREQPVLIDPAVYYGHRSMDLAMTTLFGGFDTAFYEAYRYYYPLPAHYRDQWELCNLYPLLIHLNLFGRTYLAGILHTIQSYG